jgi:tetratricopeptide (TPR) repeat protein
MLDRRSIMATIMAAMILAGTTLWAAGLRAQTSDEEAKLHYQQGVALFKEENYKMALAEFVKSYELKANWKLKLNIGICYYNLNRFVQAKQVLEEYITEGGSELEADKQAKAEGLLEQIAKVIAEVKVEANVSGATVFIDDKEVATTPMDKAVTLEAGLYSLRVEADGYKPYEKDISLAGGDQKVLDISLVKKGGTAEETGTVEGSGAGEVKGGGTKVDKGAKPKGKKKIGALGISAIAIAPLALGAFGGVVATGLENQVARDDYNKCVVAEPGSTRCKKFKDDALKYENITNALISVGVVLAAASVGLGVGEVVVQKKKAKKGASLRPLPTLAVTPPIGADGALTISIGGQF